MENQNNLNISWLLPFPILPQTAIFLSTCQESVSLLKFLLMKTMSVGEFKTHFSEVLQRVLAGEEIGIMYGKKKELVAKLVPKTVEKKLPRKLGILEGKSKIKFHKDFKITEEDFLSV